MEYFLQAKYFKRLAAFVTAIALMMPSSLGYAENKVHLFRAINSAYGTSEIAKEMEKAKEQGKNILHMYAMSSADVGNLDFTSDFIEVSYKKSNGEDDIDYRGVVKKGSLGNYKKDIITFKSGANITVNNIYFTKNRRGEGAFVVIEEGATVRFNNVSFANELVNNGTAIFNDTEFQTNTIRNNGEATYTGSTVEPRNTGTPKPPFVALSLVLAQDEIQGIKQYKSMNESIGFELKGTNKDIASKSVTVTPENAGVSASVENNLITITGAPTQAGTYTVKVKATSTKRDQSEDVAEATLRFEVAASAKEDKVYAFGNVNQGAGTALSDHLLKAKSEDANILYMLVEQPQGNVGNAEFTEDFKEFSYKKNAQGEEEHNIWLVGNPVKKARLSSYDKNTITFKAGSNITVKNINFARDNRRAEGVFVVIEEGAVVHFKNVAFVNTVVNKGTAIFEDTVFETGKIDSSGSAEYLGSTQSPQNIGTPSTQFVPLTLSLSKDSAEIGLNNPITLNIPFVLGGTNKASAVKTVRVVPENAGITATVVDDAVQIIGTATQNEYQIVLSVSATKPNGSEDRQEKTIRLKVSQGLEARIVGSLSGFAPNQDASSVDVISGASGSGGSVSSSENNLKLEIKEGDKPFVNFFDYIRDTGKNFDVSFHVTPEGSGISAFQMMGSISLSGKANKIGKYELTATLTDGNKSITTNSVPFEIFDMNMSFQERLNLLPENQPYWLMAPFFIKNTEGGATIPTHLKKIYGSNESGLYGIIGNEHAGLNYGKDVITIPSGADLTFVNMKLYSSVKLVVEAGAKLTLDDSGAYGPIVVNGGTLTLKNSSAITNSITLNEGSVLENSVIKSYASSLTDGNRLAENKADTVVTVNGNVIFRGQNTILAAYGDASHKGQTGLKVNQGTITLEDGAELNVEGGGDPSLFYAIRGGDAVVLNDGHIVGRNATLQVKGGTGHSNSGSGGHGVAGTGTLDVGIIRAAGGMGYGSDPQLWGQGPGGDSIQRSVTILNQDSTFLEAIGGKGNPPGISYQAGDNSQNNGSTDQGTDQGNNQGTDQGNNQGSDQGTDQGNNQGTDQGNNQGTDQGNNQGSDQGTDQGNNQGSDQGTDQGNNQGSDQGTDQGNNQGSDQGNNQGTDQGENQGTDQGNNQGTDQGNNQGTDQGNNQGSDQGNNQGTDQGNNQGTDQGNNQGKIGGGGSSGMSRSAVRPDPFRSSVTEIDPQEVPLSQSTTASAPDASKNLADALKNADQVMSKFTDLSKKHWAYESVREAVAKGYYSGISDNSFSPNRPITRAEIITILGRILNADVSKEKNVYTDVQEKDYFASYAAWAYSKGYFVSDGNTFKPHEKMTREQVAEILAQILNDKVKVEVKKTSYKDANLFSAEAKSSIDLVTSAEVLSGYANGNFGAKDYLTRAQLASIALRIEKALAK